MADFEIVRAQRSQAKLRLALTAPSGGGKTWSSLVMAKGLVESLIESGHLTGTVEGKIGVVDTERGSAQLYSHLCPFDVIDLHPPYTVDRYLGAVRQLERAGYAVIVVDQVTHAWSGDGGILSVVDKVAKGSPSTFNAWASGTPEYQRFVDGLLAVGAHLICTMRQKTKWELVEKQNAQGRMVKAPTRIGLAPEQRAGFEYEFTTLLGLAVDGHMATTLKDRSGVFPEGEAYQLSEDLGKRLAGWLTTGAALAAGDDGPPLERLDAVVAAGKRRMTTVSNGPDLARVFESVWRAARRIAGELEASQAKPLLDDLVAAKDDAKARFPDLRATYARAADVAAAEQVAAKTATKPAPNGAQALVDSESVRRHGADLLAPPVPAGAFDDMEDDLPWKD